MTRPQHSKRKPSPWIAAQRKENQRRRSEYLARMKALRRENMTPEQAEAVRRTRVQVNRARIVVDNSQARIDAAVIKLRDLGLSWDQIAAAIDTSRQGAMKRHAAAQKRTVTKVDTLRQPPAQRKTPLSQQSG